MVAWAEPDTFYLGNSHSGSRTITSAGTIVNSYGVLVVSSQTGDTSLVVSSTTGFNAGDLVMVLQTTGLSVIPASGDQSPTDISGSPTAHWELARVATVDSTAGRIVLSAPMVTAFTALVSQLITVPEYSDLTINSGASIIASAWTLASGGGVIAFLVNGPIVNNGAISADKAGFRGGGYVDDPTFLSSTGCMSMDENPTKGAQKGEGLADARYGVSRTGRGNVANGAGGGICQGSGGGGGANFGKGGPGGFSHDGARSVGGLGGSSVVYSLLDHLSLGGGGGAGHGGVPVNQGAPGGAGGGAIFIRATAVTGNSLITAAGETAPNRSAGGGGGGGAGGSIYLRFVGTVACRPPAAIQANGGNGSTITGPEYGPGGGGGGGRILLQHGDPTLACTRVYVDAGFGGTQTNSSADGGSFYGSGPSNPASAPFVGTVVVMDGGFIRPLVPVITQPLDGAIVQQTRPQILGAGAFPDSTAVIYLDGLEVGRTAVDGRGSFSYQPSSDWSPGTHVVQAASEHDGVQSAKSDPVTFTIVLPDGSTGDGGGVDDGGGDLPPGHFGGGGCSAANSGALWWVLGTVLISCLVLRRVPRLGRR